MEAPSLQEGAARSQAIGLAEHLGYTRRPARSNTFSPAGPLPHGQSAERQVNAEIQVSYAFQDGSACLAPPDVRFTAGMLPAQRQPPGAAPAEFRGRHGPIEKG